MCNLVSFNINMLEIFMQASHEAKTSATKTPTSPMVLRAKMINKITNYKFYGLTESSKFSFNFSFLESSRMMHVDFSTMIHTYSMVEFILKNNCVF